MTLLRMTKNCQRSAPPSYKKAGIQFGIVSAYAAVLAILWYYLLHYFTSPGVLKAAVAIPLRRYSMPIFYILVFVIPTIALVCICFIIWKQKLLPKGQVGRSGSVRRRRRGRRGSSSQGTTRGQSSRKLWSKGLKGRAADITNITKSEEGGGNTGSSYGDGGMMANDNNNNNNGHSITATTASNIPPANVSYNQTTGGRLNILAMYFLRIILVFFFIWCVVAFCFVTIALSLSLIFILRLLCNM